MPRSCTHLSEYKTKTTSHEPLQESNTKRIHSFIPKSWKKIHILPSLEKKIWLVAAAWIQDLQDFGGVLFSVFWIKRRRQKSQCRQRQRVVLEDSKNSSKMASSCCKISPIISAFVFFLFFMQSQSSNAAANQSFIVGNSSKKIKFIRAHLLKINKPAVKTIQV